MDLLSGGLALLNTGLGLYGASRGASAQADAAERAAQIQEDASKRQIALARQIYNQNRLDFTPYRTLGAYAAKRLGKRIGMPEGYDPSPNSMVPMTDAPSYEQNLQTMFNTLGARTDTSTGRAPVDMSLVQKYLQKLGVM